MGRKPKLVELNQTQKDMLRIAIDKDQEASRNLWEVLEFISKSKEIHCRKWRADLGFVELSYQDGKLHLHFEKEKRVD